MTPVERIRADEATRLAWQNVFPRNNADATLVLVAIRHRLGAYETDPAKINPELIAVDHWLQEQIGIRHPADVSSWELEAYQLLEIANFEDLNAERKALGEEDREE